MWSLVAAHLSNREIAERLFLSVRTVESHVSSLMGKLRLADRRALARHAVALDAGAPRVGRRWPAAASSFVGRDSECAALLAAVSAHRMVTAVGPGGVGKTRLALRVVERFSASRRDGGWFVELVDVIDPGRVMAAIAAAAGVVAPLDGSLARAVAASLADSDAVILLDNCEHVIDAVRECASQLLESCPALMIVATSRIALRAPFEWVYAVPGLSLPHTGSNEEGDEGGDAVTLFMERARAAGAEQPLDRRRVGRLCARLDGMALAIELAAARCPALGLDGLIEGLDRSLRLLRSDGRSAGRHRSLRNAIEWSFRLLSAPDRTLLNTVSVFASWFDVDAAHAVAGAGADAGADRFDVADALARLADNSLLLVAAGEPTRYRALETIRQLAAEQLAELGHSDAVHDNHGHWCRAQLAALAQQPRDDAWCERLDRIAADARAALAWAEEHPGGPGAARLAEPLAEQLLLRGRPEESQRCYERAAAMSGTDADRARLLRLAAGAAASRLVGNDALRLLRDAATGALAADDPAAAAQDLAWMVIFARWAPGIIAVLPDPQEVNGWLALAESHGGGSTAAQAVMAVATAMGLAIDDPRIAELIARAIGLAREAKAPLVESVARDQLCAVRLAEDRLADAVRETTRRQVIMDCVPLDASTAYHFNDYLLMASEVHLAAGHLRAAARYADQLGALACYRDYPHPAIARRIKVDALAGDFEAAVNGGDRFLAAWERAGRPISRNLNVTAYAMAMVHGLLGDEPQRARWIAVTHTLMLDPGGLATCAGGWAPTFDALLELDRGRPDLAFARLCADIDDRTLWGASGAAGWRPWYAALWAEAAVLSRHPDASARLERAGAATRENAIATAVVQRAADLLNGCLGALPTHARTFARLGCAYQRRRTEGLLADPGVKRLSTGHPS